MALGARLPNVDPGRTDIWLSDTHAIHRPPGDQLHECRSLPFVSQRAGPPASGTTWSESPRTKAISWPSGDHAAAVTP